MPSGEVVANALELLNRELGATKIPDNVSEPSSSQTAPQHKLGRSDLLLPYALAYAQHGWPVLPLHTPTFTDPACSCRRRDCSSIGKHPRTLHGLRQATTDRSTVETWWGMWPDANIGIATGAESGLVVLDIDPAHGGVESLTEFETIAGVLPGTIMAHTGGRGLHLLYAHRRIDGWPAPCRTNALGPELPGLDVRGDGGYIVAAPSLHASGLRYDWCGDWTVSPAPWPMSLMWRCGPPGGAAGGPAGPAGGPAAGRPTRDTPGGDTPCGTTGGGRAELGGGGARGGPPRAERQGVATQPAVPGGADPVGVHSPATPYWTTEASLAALAGALRVVRRAREGNRNNALNWAAWCMGHQAANGMLPAEFVAQELAQAAQDAGLGQTEAIRTITSAFRAAGALG
jgi:Bifunctional DNA primase/polymerase, N-terminal